MKKLQAIKKRLPPGIDMRISSKNAITFRARYRRKGYPEETTITSDLDLAKAWLEEKKRNAFLGIHLPHVQSSKHTLSKAIDRYIAEELPRKPRNARNVRQHLERFRKELGEYALSAIRPSLINEKRVILENEIIKTGKKRSPTTVRHYLVSLSHLFTLAVKDWEWLHENPMDKVSKPRPAPPSQRYLSKEEIKNLLESAKSSRCPILYTVVVLALSTGMRRGEIMHLTIGSIDVVKGVIKLTCTKNGKPRLIPLRGQAYELICPIYEERKRLGQSVLLFPSPNNALRPYDIQTAWEAALTRAKIKKFTFHGTRHTNASILAAHGRTLKEIGDSLGHESYQSTNRYAHLTYEHTEKMIEEVDQELFGDDKIWQITNIPLKN